MNLERQNPIMTGAFREPQSFTTVFFCSFHPVTDLVRYWWQPKACYSDWNVV